MYAAERTRIDVAQVTRGPDPSAPPCTRDTPRCADARSYLAALRPCCRGHLVAMMGHLIAVFAELRVRWWADYGTLLGAVRNPMTTAADYPWLTGLPAGPLAPGIIPHDKDGDLGVLFEDWPKLQRAVSRLRRFGYQPILRPIGWKLKLRFSPLNHTNIDVFCWLRDEQRPEMRRRNRYVAHLDECKGREFPESALFPVTTVPWEGLTLPAPADPEAFCAFRYGPGWRVPIAANHDGVRR